MVLHLLIRCAQITTYDGDFISLPRHLNKGKNPMDNQLGEVIPDEIQEQAKKRIGELYT